MKGYSAVNDLPASAVKNSIVLQCSKTRQFYLLPDSATAESFIIDHSAPDRFFSEMGVVTKDFHRPLKLFIDFDWEPKAKVVSTSRDIFEGFIMPAMLEYMKVKYGLGGIHPSDFLFFPMDAPDKSKISFHAVLNSGYFFRDMGELLSFMKGFKLHCAGKGFLEKYAGYIDFTRYSSNPKLRNDREDKGVYFGLRAPIGAKAGRRKFIPEGSTFHDCLVLYYPLITHPEPMFIDGVADRGIQDRKPIQYNNNESCWVPLNEDESIQLMEKVLPYDKDCLEIKGYNKQKIAEFRRFSKVKEPSKCSICKGAKTTHNTKVPYAYLTNTGLALKCHSNRAKGQIYPSIKVLVRQTTAGPSEDTLLTHELKGKIIHYQYGHGIMKTEKDIICLKGCAVMEMVCPLFRWTVRAIPENETVKYEGAQVPTYHLHSVTAVQPICLPKDAKWVTDSWRHFSLGSVHNCFSNVKYISAVPYEYYKKHRNDSLMTFIGKCEHWSLRNVWLTEASLLRLCNEYPDTYRSGQPLRPFGGGESLIDMVTVFGTPLYIDHCDQLFNSQKALTELVNHISITKDYIEFLERTPGFNESLHRRKLELCLMYQDMFREVLLKSKGDRIMPKVFPMKQIEEIGDFFRDYGSLLTARWFKPEENKRFGINVDDENSMVFVFFPQEHTTVFPKLIQKICSLNLVEDTTIEEYQDSRIQHWTYEADEGRYTFPKKYAKVPTIADTILFINDAMTNCTSDTPIRFNPQHAWNHLRVLWEYRKAREEDRLNEWKVGHLQSGTNVFTDPLFEGSLFFIYIFCYDNPPS